MLARTMGRQLRAVFSAWRDLAVELGEHRRAREAKAKAIADALAAARLPAARVAGDFQAACDAADAWLAARYVRYPGHRRCVTGLQC